MGMLSAFVRGAAGQGLIDLSQRMDRRDAMASENERRDREREEERNWRSAEAQKDRDSRAESAALRTKRGSGSGGGGDGDDDADRYAVAEVMKREGVSEAQARAMVEASRAGNNPIMNEPGDGMGPAVPDTARWAQVNRTIAEAMIAGPSMAKSNYEQLEGGRGQAQRNTITGGMLAGKLTPAQTAEGVAATKGEGAFGKGGVNQFSGTPDAVGKSTIAENLAQAGSAGRANRDNDPTAKLPPAVKARLDLVKKRAEQVSNAILKAQADGLNEWNPSQNPAQAQLVNELTKLDGEARELLKPYLPEQPKPKVDPEQARREAAAAVASGAPLDRVNARLKEMGLEPITDKPAAPVKPTEKAAAKPDAKPGMLDRLKARAGEMIDAATEDPKAYAQRRVAEAKAGGKPLTPGERQLAEKYGIAA